MAAPCLMHCGLRSHRWVGGVWVGWGGTVVGVVGAARLAGPMLRLYGTLGVGAADLKVLQSIYLLGL